MLAKISIACLSVVGIAQLALADPPQHPHHKPPAEAIDACKGKQANDTCSFTHRDHAIDGTCFQPPDGGELACKPEGPPPPPPEAVDACAKAQRGDACAFDVDEHHVTGSCEGPADRPLACRPGK